MKEKTIIYNSRNYSILLNYPGFTGLSQSTTVEIILYYLTLKGRRVKEGIYNSRNYSILLNLNFIDINGNIYNSRNYSILLNLEAELKELTIYNSRNYSILLNS